MQKDHKRHIWKKVLTLTVTLLLMTGSSGAYSMAGETGHEHRAGDVQIEYQIPPGCIESGSQDEVVYCLECGAELSRETVPIPAGHTPGEPVWDDVVPATCIAPGSHDEVIYCTVCGAELSRETREDPLLPHVPGEPVRENDDEVVYCQVCQTELERRPVQDLFTDTDLDLDLDGAVPEQTETIQPVRVVFSSNAQDVQIQVWSGADPVAPEADGNWMLTPGDYTYTAAAADHKAVEGMPLHVEAGNDGSPVTVEVRMKVIAGNCGITDEDLTWTLSKEGTLAISGSGAMADFQSAEVDSSKAAPWYESRNEIKTIEISEGVTVIGTNAFAGCDAVESIKYGGSDVQWDAIEMKEGNAALANVTIQYAFIAEKEEIAEAEEVEQASEEVAEAEEVEQASEEVVETEEEQVSEEVVETEEEQVSEEMAEAQGEEQASEEVAEEAEHVEEKDIYTVSFHANGHDLSIASQEIAEGEVAALPDIPSEEGYGFGGWFKDAECIDPWNFDTDTVTGDMILYAKWLKAPALAEGLVYNDEAQSLITLADVGTWIRIEDEEAGNSTPWVKIGEAAGETADLKRTDAGTYHVYWYYGDEGPAAEETGHPVGQVVIAKADAEVIEAPEVNTGDEVEP